MSDGLKKELLSEEELRKIAGGKNDESFAAKREEFEKAWNSLGMDRYGFSGQKMAALMDEWELAGYTPNALTFLANNRPEDITAFGDVKRI